MKRPKIETLEDLARHLLNSKISFQYSADFITITSSNYEYFRYASYHSETGQLILMDMYYRQFDTTNLL